MTVSIEIVMYINAEVDFLRRICSGVAIASCRHQPFSEKMTGRNYWRESRDE